MEVPCRPEGPDDRENRFWQKSESNERGDRPWGSVVSRSHEQEYIHIYIHIHNAHGVRERFASSRLATISTILARTGGGKFGNKICSRQLDRARCQKRLLILYHASSISCQVLIRLRIRRGWMLFNIQKGLPSALTLKNESMKRRPIDTQKLITLVSRDERSLDPYRHRRTKCEILCN